MKNILIIDDDRALLNVLSAALTEAGYFVETTTSGQEGLQRAYEWLPDLILCDVRMPDLEGTTVLQALRVDPSTADRQVVLMTGSTRSEITTRTAMDLGADDFLEKPFRIEALLRCVQARLARNEVSKRVAERTFEELRQALHSTLPHEFFTPLAGILGLAELLRTDLSSIKKEEAEGMLRDIERSARRLHRSLSNYLKIVEMETESNLPPPPPLSPETTWQVVAAAATAAAERREREADLQLLGEGLPLPLDETNLSSIIEELTDNACSYSRRGSPVLLRLSKDTEKVRITIEDQGRGMTEAQIQRIGLFRQFDRQKYEQQGLGLGLALVRKLVESHGGTFEVISHPLRGTRIDLCWPTQLMELSFN